jgi:hypothetical protein
VKPGTTIASAVVLVVLLVAACGDPAPSPPASVETAIKLACSLVPDMDTLVGRTAVAAPSSYALGGRERCIWAYASDPSRFVGLTIGDASGHAATIASFGEGETVEGLGEDARWWAANQTLSVVRETQSLQLDLQLDDLSDPRALAVSIAQRALEGLP